MPDKPSYHIPNGNDSLLQLNFVEAVAHSYDICCPRLNFNIISLMIFFSPAVEMKKM